MTEADQRHMAHALSLGQRGLGRTWPNPAVGCVIVQGARIVGRGWTQPGGRPHAEAIALAQAGQGARGATAYVTLEPCAHQGKTGPCAEALVAAGVARVVTAITDPDPRVSGQGHAMLRAAGIDLTENILATQALAANAGFLKRVTQGLPFVTLKLAASLDGRTATATGESRWITGPLSRCKVHALRLSHDAVMVGSGTAIADDPDLTVRDMGEVRQPVRIVLDRLLRHSPESRLGRTAREHPVWLLHGPNAPEVARRAWVASGATLIETPETEGHLDVRAAVKTLASKGLTRILSEGGSTLAAALINAGLVDELALFSSGVMIGSNGHPALGSLPLLELSQAPKPTLLKIEKMGSDILSTWAFGTT